MKKITKKILTCFFITLITFLLGLVASDTYNFYNTDYEIIFSVNEEIDYKKIENKDYLLSIIDNLDEKEKEKYKEIDIEKMTKEEDIKVSKIEDEYKIVTACKYYENFFSSKSQSKISRVKGFISLVINDLASEDSRVTYKYENVYVVINEINNYLVSSISGVIGLLSSIVFVIFNKNDKEVIYDNKNIYRTPFHKEYFKDSMKFLDSTKKIVTLAMLFALMMVCKLFSIPSGFSNLGLSLTYLFFSLICLIYGPYAGLTVGLMSDVLGHFLFNKYGDPFYFGYTIQAMLTGLVYALCFYKTKISFSRCFIARVIVNLLLNVIWGSICFGDLMGYNAEVTKSYALLISLPKNIIYLLPQSLLLYLFFKFISPVLYRNKYISKAVYENIKK